MQAALQWEANKELPFSHSSVNGVRVYFNLQAGEDLTLFLQVFAPRSLKRSPLVPRRKVLKYFLSPSLPLFLFQPVPTSPTSTSPTPGGTLGMSKMDGPNMQDVYILSPVSGLYSTRSVGARAHV